MHTFSAKRFFSTFLLICVFLGACTSPGIQLSPTADGSAVTQAPGPPQSEAPTVDPTMATIQLAVYPPEARTGIDELDAIIDVVLAHGADTLRGLTRFTEAGCTQADGLGGPPKCEVGQAEGSLVEVVPFLGPEGHHMRREEYTQWQGPDVRGLLTAYRVSSQAFSDEYYPAGEYAIVFLEANGATDLTLQVIDGKVVRYDFGAGGSLESDLAHDAAEVILPLTLNPIPTAVPWVRFDDPRGRFAFVHPPTLTVSTGPEEGAWRLGDQIEFSVDRPGESWVACFDQALGDCPVVEDDRQVTINGADVRRVKGWIGAVGGRTPQEFLTYIFEIDGEQLIFTVYPLPFNTEVQDITTIWPLEGMMLELFERTVETVTLLD